MTTYTSINNKDKRIEIFDYIKGCARRHWCQAPGIKDKQKLKTL